MFRFNEVQPTARSAANTARSAANIEARSAAYSDARTAAHTQGSSMISDGNIPLTGQANIDDLPRTLRREHEARAREAREREAQTLGNTQGHGAHGGQDTAYHAPQSYPATQSYEEAAMPGEPYPSVVKALDIPFGHLVAFCLKAVLAAIPALFLLAAILLGIGVLIDKVAPDLPLFKLSIETAPR